MKFRILAFAILLAAPLPSRAIESLATLLPEAPAMFVSFRDSNLFNTLDEHPIAKIVRDSELRKIFSPMLKQQAAERERRERIYKEETGMTLAELDKQFAGGTVVGVNFDIVRMLDTMQQNRSKAEKPSPFDFMDFIVGMDFKGDEALAGKLARAYGRAMAESVAAAPRSDDTVNLPRFPEDFDASTDDYAGVKLHLWKIKPGVKSPVESPCYALLDGTIVVSTNERGLRGAVDRVKKGAASLADSQRHRQLLKTAGETDVLGSLDITAFVHPLMDKAAKEGGVAAAQTLTLLRAVGVQKFDFLYFTLDLSKNRADMEIGLTFHDQPGIIKVLSFDGPGTVPSFIPPDADSAGHSTWHLDRALAGIEGIMKEGVPIMGDLIGTQFDELKKRSGVDVRKDLIANIGPDYWTASAPPPRENEVKTPPGNESEDGITESQMIALKVRNRPAVELALTTLINNVASSEAIFEKREYQGHSIHTMKEEPISYLFTDDWLILSIGAPNLLERTLTRMAKGGDDHLFAQPVVKAALGGLPDGDDGSTFMDLGATLDRLLGLLAEEELDGLDAWVNLDDLPKSLNLPLVLGIRQYHDETSFRSKVHFAEKIK